MLVVAPFAFVVVFMFAFTSLFAVERCNIVASVPSPAEDLYRDRECVHVKGTSLKVVGAKGDEMI